MIITVLACIRNTLPREVPDIHDANEIGDAVSKITETTRPASVSPFWPAPILKNPGDSEAPSGDTYETTSGSIRLPYLFGYIFIESDGIKHADFIVSTLNDSPLKAKYLFIHASENTNPGQVMKQFVKRVRHDPDSSESTLHIADIYEASMLAAEEVDVLLSTNTHIN